MRLISTMSVLLPLLVSILYFQRKNLLFNLAFLLVLIGSLVEVFSLIVHVYFEVPYTNHHHFVQLSAELFIIGIFSLHFLSIKWVKYIAYFFLFSIWILNGYEQLFRIDSSQFFSQANNFRIIFLMILILVGINEFLNSQQLLSYQNSIFIFFIANFFYLGFCLFASLIRDSFISDMYRLNGSVFDLFSVINTFYNVSLALAFYYSKWDK